MADDFADVRALAEHSVLWALDPTQTYGSVRESLGSTARPSI